MAQQMLNYCQPVVFLIYWANLGGRVGIEMVGSSESLFSKESGLFCFL